MAPASVSNTIKKSLLVLGGNGYVGQNVIHAAIQSNLFSEVRSFNRSGAPPSPPPHLAESLSQVEFVKGDIFDARAREDATDGIYAVVSCIGAFGSNDFMKRLCGDATIEAVKTAEQKGVQKFGFVSSAQVYEGSIGLKIPPSIPMYGYFQGKYNAEQVLLESYPDGHVILRPGFIYGKRKVGSVLLPLQLIGAPINIVGNHLGPLSSLIQSVPFVGKEVSSMVPVESVGKAMIDSLKLAKGIILDAEEIRKF
ncbi:hypothetical protein ACHAXM_002656 [Skeletonema potamos]|jgi:nucleoside-diphosphate-sugar epimerase